MAMKEVLDRAKEQGFFSVISEDYHKLSKEDLRTFFTSQGDKAFRGNQVYEWLWSKGVDMQIKSGV